ncbi:MAG: hypothetical protein M5U19_02140 [Microthrixaceae bacterium]|nr:hypothetical protein [Microthrixaceae bacterium]
MGHPLGASGTRISLTLINELQRRGGGTGGGAVRRGRSGRGPDPQGLRLTNHPLFRLHLLSAN